MAIFAEFNGERIELNGAAEEATMKKILDAIQDQKGGSGGSAAAGGAAGAGAAGAMVKLGKSLNVVNIGFNILGRVVGGVVKGFSALAGAGSAAVKFSTALIDTQPTVKDLATGFKTITGDLLGLGSAIEAVVGLLQKNYNTFQQLSASGIMFGDRMTSLTRLGTAMGTSLQFASGELAKNAERLAYLGTATRGAAMAAEAGAEMSARFSDDLLRFGMGFEEQNERFMDFFAQNTLALQKGTMSMQYLIDNSDDYAKSLRRISEITGKSAEEQEEQVRRLRQNKMFENYLATLPEGAKLAAEQLIRAASAGGADMVDVAQAALLGVQPLTDGAQNLSALMPGLNTTFGNLANQANNFNGDLKDFTKSMEDQLRGFANSNRGFVDANSKFFSVLGMYGDPYAEAGSSIAMFVNSFNKSQGSAAGKTDKLAEAFIQLELMMKKVREIFDQTFVQILSSDTVQTALGKLADVLPIMAEEFSKFVTAIVDDIQKYGFFGYLELKFEEMFVAIKRKINDGSWLGGALINNATLEVDEAEIAVQQSAVATGNPDAAKRDDEIRKLVADALAGKQVDPSQIKNKAEYEYFEKLYKQGVKDLYGTVTGIQSMYTMGSFNSTGMASGMIQAMNDPDYQKALDAYSAAKKANPLKDIDPSKLPDLLKEPPKMYGGTLGAFGNVLHDFGKGTLGVLHNKEAVLNTTQMNNLVSNSMKMGAMASAGNTDQYSSSSASSNMAKKLVDTNHEDTVKLINGVNMLIAEVKKGTEINKRTYDVIVANA